MPEINKIPTTPVYAATKTESASKSHDPKGLMQLMPSVIKVIGTVNPMDVQENINGGVSFLKNMLEKYNRDYKKALTAYNADTKAVDDNNGISPYKETGEYAKKVINAYLKNEK